MRPVNCGTKNLFVNFSVWSERLRRAGALPAGVALAVLFALSAPSAQAKVEKITIAAIDDVVAGDEGWIIAIDDVAADAGGWITAIDEAAGAGGGVAAYAAGAGGGFAAFGDIENEFGIAAFGQIEARLFDENGNELFLEDFSDGKIPTGKPDEHTTDFPSSKDTPTITDDPVDETGFISFAASNISYAEEGSTAEVEILLTKPAPVGGIRLSFTIDGTAYAHADVEFESSSVFIPEGATKAIIPVTILEDVEHEADETLILSWYNNNLPNGWELNNNDTHTLTIVDNDAPDPLIIPEDKTPVVDKPDEDPATDVTAINPNGEPPSNENTPITITTNYFGDSALVDDGSNKSYARISFKTNEEGIEEAATFEGSQIRINDWITKSGPRISAYINNYFSGRLIIRLNNQPFLRDLDLIKDVDVGIKAVHRRDNGFVRIINSYKISDVRIGIYVEREKGDKVISVENRNEIWDVREYGIYAYHKGTGNIRIRISEDIKRIISEDEDGDFSDVYMRGGEAHYLALNQGVILDNVTFGLDEDGRIESRWNVNSGDTQTQSFAGFVDKGAYRYILEHRISSGYRYVGEYEEYETSGGHSYLEYREYAIPVESNLWIYYRELTPTAVAISNQLKDLAAISVDGTPADNFGFYVHQNSLRSSDDSVHFGFNTPVMSFMGGDLSINNNIAPNLSASLVEGMSISNSIGLDYHFDIMSFSVSPQIELAWTRFDFDDFTGPGSTGKVSLEDGDIITSRLGLSFNGDYIYGGVNLHTPIDGKTSVNVSGVSISSKQDDFSVDGLLGFSYDWNEDYETYGELFMDADEVRANLGVSIDF